MPQAISEVDRGAAKIPFANVIVGYSPTEREILNAKQGNSEDAQLLLESINDAGKHSDDAIQIVQSSQLQSDSANALQFAEGQGTFSGEVKTLQY